MSLAIRSKSRSYSAPEQDLPSSIIIAVLSSGDGFALLVTKGVRLAHGGGQGTQFVRAGTGIL